MAKCNILTRKFKEFKLASPDSDVLQDCNASNHYLHEEENEVFLVGYKYKQDTDCPEIKMRLADILDNAGGGGGSEGGGSFNPGNVSMSFIGNTIAGSGSWTVDEEGHNDLFLTMPKQLSAVTIAYDANGSAWGEVVPEHPDSSEGQRTMHLHLLPNTGEGEPGESAYQIAVENGFEGTEQEWLDSLQGEKGDQGDPGDPGQDGADGTTMDLYDLSVTVLGSRVTSVTATARTDAENSCYCMGDSALSWKKFEPSVGAYHTCGNPVIGTSDVVEIGPPDTTDACRIAYNLAYGLFGTYDSSDGFTFYSVRDPELGAAEEKIMHFSVKVYKNIGGSQAASETNL